MYSQSDIVYKTQTPLTFLAWIESKSIISKDYNDNLREYKEYVLEWHKYNNSTEVEIKDSFASLYTDLLRDIPLTFTTEEEKRFISNCDFTDPEELDIVLPFFIEKIKNIILYYHGKRENLKKKIKNLPTKGTDRSIKNTVRDVIVDEIESENLQVFLGTRFKIPSLKAINSNLNVKVEELYDGEDYSDIPPPTKELDIDPNLYLDFKEAIIHAIKKYPVFLKNLQTTFTFNLNLSGNEAFLLKPSDFVDYFTSNQLDDLKLLLYKDLSVKLMGSDFYYLSTNSTGTTFTSGALFKTTPLSGNPIHNILNRRYPSFVSAPSLNSLYTAYECGKFFVPTKTGLLEYNTFDKKIKVDTSKIQPNKVYIFPDPRVTGSIRDEDIKQHPLIYEIDVSFNRVGKQNAFIAGDVDSSSLNNLFYPYASLYQERTHDQTGVSSPNDSLTFWDGERDTFWTNSDIWPDLSRVEKLPIDKRLDSLLLNEGTMVKWFVDLYGNEYGLFKRDIKHLSDKKTKTGKIFVKSTNGIVQEFTEALNSVLIKLPLHVVNEIKDALNLYVINQTILIETKNYVIVDIISYDLSSQKYTSSLYPGFYRQKYTINPYLEKLIGYTYRSDNNALYLCFTTLNPHLSTTNYKDIRPLIFKVDIDQKTIYTVYTGTESTIQYSLSTAGIEPPEIDLRYIDSGHFSHKESQNLYNITFLAYNLNGVPFVVNEKFYSTAYQEHFISTRPLLFKPFLYVYDTNFSLHENKTVTQFTSPYTDYAGHYLPERFRFHRESDVLVDQKNLNTFFINEVGEKTFKFDWKASNVYGIFIGCSGFKFEKIDDLIYFPHSEKIIYQSETDIRLFDFTLNQQTFVVYANIAPGSDNSQITIKIENNTVINENDFLIKYTGDLCSILPQNASYTINQIGSYNFEFDWRDNNNPTNQQSNPLIPFNNPNALASIRNSDDILTFNNDIIRTFNFYSGVNFYTINIGCSSFDLYQNSDEGYLFATNYGIFIYDDNNFYTIATFNEAGRIFNLKAKIEPNTSRSKVNFVLDDITYDFDSQAYQTAIQPYTGSFCDVDYNDYSSTKIVRRDNVIAVGAIDPAFINTTGTTFLHLDWSSYNVVNLFIGCSSFNILFAEDVLLFPQLEKVIIDSDVWYEILTFELEDRSFFVNCKMIGNTNKELLEFYIGETLAVNELGLVSPPFSGVFCNTIYSQFKTVEIYKVGTGTGRVKSDPACADCGEKCDFLYPLGSTVSFRASADSDSVFIGWLGSECEGAAGDCFLTITDNTSISAIFNKLPRYDLTIFVNNTAAAVSNFDGSIFCPGVGECTYNVLGGTPVTLSASAPPQGYVFRGFVGEPSCGDQLECAFFVNRNIALTAFYEPEWSYLRAENIFLKNEREQTIHWYVMGRSSASDEEGFRLTTNVVDIQDSEERGVDISGHNEIWGVGTMTCSLCPSLTIYHYHDFTFKTGLFCFLSCVPFEPYQFAGFEGFPCTGNLQNFCSFANRDNRTVSGVFIPPTYFLSVQHFPESGNINDLGTVIFYETRNRISCETYRVNQICETLYLSGTRLFCNAYPYEGSFVHSIIGSNNLLLSSTNTSGFTGISADFVVTENTFLSVISEALDFVTLTIYKSSFSPSFNLFNTIIVTPGQSGEPTYTINAFTSAVTLTYPKNTLVEILPNDSGIGKASFVVGYSGLKYPFVTFEQTGLTLDPSPTLFDQGPTFLLINGEGIQVQGTTGPLIALQPPINIDYRESIARLTESASVTCLFEPKFTVTPTPTPTPTPTLTETPTV